MRSETTTATETVTLDNLRAASESEAAPEPLETTSNPGHPTGIRLVCITIGLLLSIFLGALDSTILAQAIPSITETFHGLSNVAWYSTAYSISNTAFKLAWGKAFKDFRLKPTFLLAMAIFEVGNVVAALAQSSVGVIMGRIISGLGGSGMMSGSFVILALSVKEKYRPMMMGVTSLAFGVSSVAGPVLGGALVDGLGWRWCFWINLPFGALAAGIMVAFYRQPPSSTIRQDTLMQKVYGMDINGAFLVGGSLVCFVLAMHWIGSLPWHSPQIIGSLVGFFGLALAFAFNEKLMGSNAMFQPRLLRNRKITMNCLFALFFSGVLFPLSYILPIQFQTLGSLSAASSGIRMIPLLVTVCIFTLITNGLLTWKQTFSPLFVCGALTGTAGALFMYKLDGQAAAENWIGAEILTSFGVGLALQLPIIANNACVGVEDISMATSLALFFENVGTTIFVSASEAALTSGLVQGISDTNSGLDAQALIDAGAISLRTTFSKSQLPDVLSAYQRGCRSSHLVPVACGSAAALIAITSAFPSANRRVQKWIANQRSNVVRARAE